MENQIRSLIGGLRWVLYFGIAVSLLVILSIIVFGTDDDVDPLFCSVEVLFLLMAAFGGLKRLQNKYLKSGEGNVTQSKMPVAESQ